MAKRKPIPVGSEALPRATESAFRKMVGRPIACQKTQPETGEEKIAALLARIHELENPEINEYQRNFTKFRTELCWTRDEARGGRVAPIPDHPYLREVDDALIECTPILIEKSRRTLISWTVCALDLWILAGGQDPRWPALMHSTCNRKVIIAARKLEGEGGSADYLERLRFMADQFEERGFRQHWSEFPTFEWRFDRGRASNGSIVSAVPQGADQLRGSGVTVIHAEELGFWTEAKTSIASALQTLQGGGDSEEDSGGHLIGVTTAAANTFAHEIVKGELRQRGW